MYFALYFLMTGLHGLHVLIGMGLLSWVALRARRGEFGPDYSTPVELSGLYWHLVDLIWIFLFPLLYLL
jgi:cytochrome c oxidase subunit 3